MTNRYKAIAEYYDAENAHYAMLQRDVPFLLDHLPRKSQQVLELAVGTGRAAIPLAQAGHRLVGIDYDRDILKIARKKRDAVGLSSRQLDLRYGDALRLNLKEHFDWVILLYNTLLAFVTLEEQDRLLQNVVRHLKPRGRFWIDIFQPNLSLLAQDKTVGLEAGMFHVPSLNRTVFRTTDVKRDPARQVQKVTFNYQWFDEFEQTHREKVRFDLTFLFPRELQLLLERNGLKIDTMYGNYDGSELVADSPRMIACCKLA